MWVEHVPGSRGAEQLHGAVLRYSRRTPSSSLNSVPSARPRIHTVEERHHDLHRHYPNTAELLSISSCLAPVLTLWTAPRSCFCRRRSEHLPSTALDSHKRIVPTTTNVTVESHFWRIVKTVPRKVRPGLCDALPDIRSGGSGYANGPRSPQRSTTLRQGTNFRNRMVKDD